MIRIRKRVAFPAVLAALLFLFCRANYEVPVLMYHHVGDPGLRSSINVSTETFERQMEFLKVHRYNVIGLSELIEKIKSGDPVPLKTVAITFDDGNLDNFQNAFPALKSSGFPATIFMITGNIGRKGWLSEEDLRILDESGITIGSHTVNHAFLPGIRDPEVQRTEIRDSKLDLEKVLGHPVGLFSYPAGGVTRPAQDIVRQEGYQGAVTTNYGKRRHDPYALHRIKISDAGGNLFNFWIKTSGLYHLGKKRIDAE